MPRKKLEPVEVAAPVRQTSYPNIPGTTPMTITRASVELQCFRVEATGDDGQKYLGLFGAAYVPHLLDVCRVQQFEEVLGKRIAAKVVATLRLDNVQYVLASSFCEALPHETKPVETK